MHRYIRAFDWLLTLLLAVALVQYAQAQPPEIPGVTDITSVTTLSTLDSAWHVRYLSEACQDSSYFVKQVRDFRGVVEYRSDLRFYVIASGLPDVVYVPHTMICGQWTGIVCNWPLASRWGGKVVTFSGRYFRARGVLPRYGGEHIFFLFVTVVR